MYKILSISILAFLAFTAQAQTQCKPTLEYIVNTESGLKMREGPGTNFNVVSFVPAKEGVLICEELSTPATFEDISGHWRRVRYKDKYGYMFDGFLTPAVPALAADVSSFKMVQLALINQLLAQNPSKIDSTLRFLNQVARTQGYEKLIGKPKADIDTLYWVAKTETTAPPVEEKKEEVVPAKPPIVLENFEMLTELSNYCGDIAAIDPGKIWYAIHRRGDNFYRSRVDIEILKSKYSLGKGLEFDIRSSRRLEVAFFISSEKPLDTNWRVNQPFDYFVLHPNKLFPGQQTEIYAYDPVPDIHNVTLFATGAVLEVGQCPVLEKYAIKVTGEMNDQLIVQNLTPDFSYLGQCGQPEIYWFGDLNGDLYPDIIFVSMGDKGTLFTLFMSNLQDDGKLYRKADEWFNKTCE